MRHPHRPRQLGTAMRGQRPSLAGIWAWLAIVAMLLAGLAGLHRTSLDLPAAAALQTPAEDRGGESSTHEQSPAKLRRVVAPAARSLPATPPSAPPLLVLDAWLVAFPVALAIPDVRGDWPLLTPQTPWADRPGRRVQRGQAPPHA